MGTDADFLMELKNKITKAEQNLISIKTEQKVILRKIQEEYQCSSIEEAESLIKKLQKKLDKENETVAAIIQELKEKYNVITNP